MQSVLGLLIVFLNRKNYVKHTLYASRFLFSIFLLSFFMMMRRFLSSFAPLYSINSNFFFYGRKRMRFSLSHSLFPRTCWCVCFNISFYYYYFFFSENIVNVFFLRFFYFKASEREFYSEFDGELQFNDRIEINSTLMKKNQSELCP